MTSKGERTKQKIIRMALRLFYQKGFESVTMQEIAKKLNLTHPALYKYYKNKLDLLKDCFLLSTDEGREFIDRHVHLNESASKRLQGYMKANLDWAIQHPEQTYPYILLFQMAATSKTFDLLCDQVFTQSIARLKTILIHGQREKAWKMRSPQQSAETLHNFLLGTIIKLYLGQMAGNLNQFFPRFKRQYQALMLA